jgi:hypothetical protein
VPGKGSRAEHFASLLLTSISRLSAVEIDNDVGSRYFFASS